MRRQGLLVLAAIGLAACGGGVSVDTASVDTASEGTTSTTDTVAPVAPLANQDHWHAAYGVFVCGEGFLAPLQVQDDPVGIHTHGDGIIHIHPFTSSASGANAVLGVFLDAAAATVDDQAIDVSELSVREGEDTCGERDEPGVVQVAYWANARTASSTDPEIVTEDLRDVPFEQDGSAYTIAFAPEGATIPPPPTIPTLDALSDVSPGGAVPGSVPGTLPPTSEERSSTPQTA